MANTYVTPVAINPTLYLNTANQINANLLEDDGATPLDASAWSSCSISLFGSINGLNILIGEAVSLLPTFSTPTDTWSLTAAQIGDLTDSNTAFGPLTIVITGVPSSGADPVVLATGTAFVVQSENYI